MMIDALLWPILICLSFFAAGFFTCLVIVNLEGPRRWITEYEERVRETDL